jgi:hypothetical protein
MGQVHLQPIPSPVEVTRATYRRDAVSAQADVFATAKPSIGAPNPVLSIAGATILGTVMANQGSLYHGQPQLRTPQDIPASVIITNSADTPTSFTEANLVDEVRITSALYDSASQQLTVQASSSDRFDPAVLVAEGFGTLTGGTLVAPAAVPPAEVTVISNHGGRASAMVAISQAAAPAAPFADNDVIAAALPADVASTIDILGNDNPGHGTATPRILANPVHGTVSINASGNAVYTPSLAFSGADSFSYINSVAGVDSNVALVSFNVAFVNHAPVANPDSAAVSVTTPATINVLANDTDPDGDALNPASVTIVTPPASGTAVANPDGTIGFTPGPTGTVTFQYTVQDAAGATSNAATVTVTVASPDIITIIRAQFRTQKRDWRITGTNTIPGPGNTITIHNGPTLASPVLGTIAVDAAGGWDFVLKGSSIAPDATRTISVESTKGGVRLAIPLLITN